jgi:hypothetical protein
MQNQLGGQYVRSRNSNHGILVLFRLDSKKWEIPESPARGDFNELIRYLQRQADVIKMNNAGVDDLQVLGIDCVPPITMDSNKRTPRRSWRRGGASMSDQTDPTLLHFAPAGTLGAKTPS